MLVTLNLDANAIHDDDALLLAEVLRWNKAIYN
jgi:hypothetical protein